MDALAELLRTALRRVQRNTTPDTARFLSDGGWLHSRERQFTRTCNADVRLEIHVEPVSRLGGGGVPSATNCCATSTAVPRRSTRRRMRCGRPTGC